MHDAILVGIGTALNDNPQLNSEFRAVFVHSALMLTVVEARHLPQLPSDGSTRYNLPRPIILDTHLRLRLDCKLVNNYKAGIGRRPWVVAFPGTDDEEVSAWTKRKNALESVGVRVIEVASEDGAFWLLCNV